MSSQHYEHPVASVPVSSFLDQLYDYNAWGNRQLFAKLEILKEAHKAELATALQLVNHYHIVAQIFASHMTSRQQHHATDYTDETPTIGELRSAVNASDEWYLGYIRSLSPTNLSEPVRFKFTDGQNGTMTREEMLTHVALHCTYHRGEVGRIFWQLSITPPWDTFGVYLHQSGPARRLHQDG